MVADRHGNLDCAIASKIPLRVKRVYDNNVGKVGYCWLAMRVCPQHRGNPDIPSIGLFYKYEKTAS
jgi:hypothetical protein